MLAIKLTLLIVVVSVYTLSATASDDYLEQVAVESENASHMQPGEQIVLEREKRSPWGGRRRRRWGASVKKAVGKAVAKGIKIANKVKNVGK